MCECVCACVCMCVRVCTCARTREGEGPVFTENTLEAGIYQHLCAVKKNTSCCGPFIRFPASPGFTCGQELHQNSRTCFIPAPGTHRNRFERQGTTAGEREMQELGERRKRNTFEECPWHRLSRTKHSSLLGWHS